MILIETKNPSRHLAPGWATVSAALRGAGGKESAGGDVACGRRTLPGPRSVRSLASGVAAPGASVWAANPQNVLAGGVVHGGGAGNAECGGDGRRGAGGCWAGRR